ncbi:MAG: glycoside hydrolase family 9 protein [Anaerolineae bacterium]|nr:glycoside hydrolase family 9 protein [Anaerolineae bacterium]
MVKQVFSNKSFLYAAFVVVLTLLITSPVLSAPDAPPPPGYRKVRDWYVFKDTLPGTWSCHLDICDLNAPNNLVPIDTSPEGMYNGLPSLKLEISGPNKWWWLVILAGKGWTSYSLENYAENGFLEFNVKSASGGEHFNITLTDVVPGRASGVEHNLTVNTANYVTISTEWQHVKIPLRDFNFGSDPEFNLRQVRDVRFSEDYWGPYAKTIWINDLKFTSPDDEAGFPAIKVNQLGYNTQAEKYALVTGFYEELPLDEGAQFVVRRADDHEPVYTGTLSLVTDFDRYVSGEKILKADFTPLTAPGRYYIDVTVPATGTLIGGNSSLEFEIGKDIYHPLVVDAARYFYYQRQGITLTAEHAGAWARGLGHPQDSAVHLRSYLEGYANTITTTFDVSQGWYDAGDYGKYVPYAATAVNDLLSAYEMFPEVFTDGQLNIPESGNGIPDLLDEVKWELDWVLKMQDPSDGGFYERVYPNNPQSGKEMPDEDDQVRYIEDLLGGTVPNTKPTQGTAKGVAYLAHASVVYRPFDEDYADRLLAAAEAGWRYLEAHPECYPDYWQGCHLSWDPEPPARFWAAAELFKATGAITYNNYFLDHYQAYASDWLTTTENAGGLFLRAFMAYNESPNADPTEKEWFIQHFNQWREMQLQRSETYPWRNFLKEGGEDEDSDYYWGSNGVTLETIIILARGSKIAGNYDARLIRAARAQLNYILGINPIRHSYVAGYGQDSVQTLFSHIYSNDEKPGIPPGYMAEGPNQFDGGGLSYSQFYGKCYVDNNSDWTVSEHSLSYNARLVFVAAMVAKEAVSDFTVTKTVAPTGNVRHGDLLTYTIDIAGVPGTGGVLHDPLTNLHFVRFVEAPAGITYAEGAVGGALTIPETGHAIVSFVVAVDLPTPGQATVSNQACIVPEGGTLGDAICSNIVQNTASRPYVIYMPLVMRNRRG